MICRAVLIDLKPRPGRTSRLIRRWSCSTILPSSLKTKFATEPEKEKLEAQIDNLREQTWIPQRPVTFNKVIEMKEPEREAIKRLAKEPLPDVEEMLFELEQRLDALEARGALPIEIQIWVRGARDSIALIREQIILQLKHIQEKCDRI